MALGFGIVKVMWLEANGRFARDPKPANSAMIIGGGTPS
ncbi:MAG: hypothetical protein CPDRYMAC_5107 [uncultured Paraburkholderia sp.]|nr:MAG: hypothetical protein CPDRYDRY_5016 [uncultured Paraburkholderia sp.]CAH2939649.1 MAG: hypothetical protein CPDRYMAC_5107 [uncultured Paraburkholderia sp.]